MSRDPGMPSNPHHLEALASDALARRSAEMATIQSAQLLQEIAFELRTANLIGAISAGILSTEEMVRVRAEVRERIGLPERPEKTPVPPGEIFAPRGQGTAH